MPVITQPIQVNSRPDGLPESRTEVSGAELPRLDVSLAGQDSGATASGLLPDGVAQPARTKVQLPQLGVETHKFNPDDFIVPAAAPAISPSPVVAPLPVLEPVPTPDYVAFPVQEPPHPEFFLPAEAEPSQYTPISLPSQTGPIPLEDLDSSFYNDLPDDLPAASGHGEVMSAGHGDSSFQNTVFPDHADSDSSGPNSGLPEWGEREMTGGQKPGAASDVPWNWQPDSAISRSGPSGDPGEGRQGPETQPIQPVPQNLKVETVPVNLYEELPAAPLRGGSFGKLFSQQSDQPERTAVLPPSAPGEEADVLEKLFGDHSKKTGSPRGLSKTGIIMVSGIAGAAILSTVVVIFFFESFGGGFDVSETYGTPAAVVESQPAVGDTNTAALPAEPSIVDAPAVIDPVALVRESAINNPDKREAPVTPANNAPGGSAAPRETESPALSFDERVQQVVNGTEMTGGGGSVIGSPGLDPVDGAISKFNGSETPGGLTPLVAPALQGPSSSGTTPASQAPSAVAAATTPAAPGASPLDAGTPGAGSLLSGSAAKSANYNPPASFAAPGPAESPLLRTNDVIDAFLRAPDWQTRVKYTFQGESLQAAIEDYYKKWPDKRIERYSLQLFQMEQSAELGGPYWVYLVSSSDMDQGFPLIIRVEDGNLKVDWEIYSEFYDRHFVRFREGTMPRPATFRVVIERVSDYYGSDREAFTSLKDYYVYQINPPYGDLNEFSEYAFAKKDSELAKKLEKVVGLGDEPLAVIITLDEKAFEHGIKHYVITDYLTEGWFR